LPSARAWRRLHTRDGGSVLAAQIHRSIGEVFTPFAFARANGEWLDVNTTNSYTFGSAYGTSTYFNSSQQNFLGTNNPTFYGEFIPGAGLEYRYPFFAKTSFASMVFEPIGQIIVRPNQEIGSNSLVNLDAQSLVFDTSNLFDWSKYSGYDRFETGLRRIMVLSSR